MLSLNATKQLLHELVRIESHDAINGGFLNLHMIPESKFTKTLIDCIENPHIVYLGVVSLTLPIACIEEITGILTNKPQLNVTIERIPLTVYFLRDVATKKIHYLIKGE